MSEKLNCPHCQGEGCITCNRSGYIYQEAEKYSTTPSEDFPLIPSEVIIARFTREKVTAFIKEISIMIKNGDEEWYYIPYWFKKLGDNIFELYSLDKFPEKIKKLIKDLEDAKRKV